MAIPQAKNQITEPAKHAFKISLMFFILTIVWISSTDLYMHFAYGMSFDELIYSHARGFFFAVVSCTVLYFLMKKYLIRSLYATRKLTKCEEEFRSLADSIAMGITRRDTNGRCLFANVHSLEIAQKIPGFIKTSELVGKTPAETYADHVIADAIMGSIKEAVDSAKPVNRELKYKELFFEGRFFPELDEQGRVVSVITIVSNRTAEKEQFRLLKDSERFNRSLINSFPGSVYIFDLRNLQNVYANRFMTDSLGYGPAELEKMKGNLQKEVIHPDDLSFYLTIGILKIRALKDDEFFENTYRMKDSLGRWRWFKNREIVFSRSASGEVQQVLGTAHEITDFKLAEEELQNYSSYLNAVVEASPMAIFDLDESGHVVSLWNTAAENMFGFTSAEAIGKILPTVDETKKEEFLKNLAVNFSGEGFWGKELIRKNKSGNDICISIYTKPIKNPEGKVVRVLAYNEDLTLRKKFESEISRYSNYLKMLYEAGLYTVGTFDLKEIYRTLFEYISKIVNTGSVVIFSYDETHGTIKCEASCVSDKMIDVSFLPNLHLDDPRSSLLSKAILTGESILVNDCQSRIETKEKMTLFDVNMEIDRANESSSLPAGAMVIPLKHNNKTSGALQVSTFEAPPYNLEDLRRIEPLAVLIASAIERARLYEKAGAELAEKNKALEQIRKISKALEQSPNSIIITDSQGSIEYVNPYFSELTGYTSEEVYGKNPFILQSGQTPAHSYEELWKTIASGEVWQGEFLNRKKSGELFWESASVGPVFDENNNITHYIAIKQDITEKKIRDEELNNSLLEKENMLKEIHHRVKNNLQVVSSLLNMQAEQQSHPEAIEAINTSRNRVKAMALVHENLYRSSNLMRTSMDNYIRMLVKNIYSAYGVTFDRIDLSCNIDELGFGPDTIIPLGLIINETVSNSLKHAFPSGRSGIISISLSSVNHPEGKYLLVVKDNGIGFPADFNPLSSASLGMTLISSLASQLGCTAEIKNEQGTQIRIRFNELKYKSRV